jgi:hypothetical protein
VGRGVSTAQSGSPSIHAIVLFPPGREDAAAVARHDRAEGAAGSAGCVERQNAAEEFDVGRAADEDAPPVAYGRIAGAGAVEGQGNEIERCPAGVIDLVDPGTLELRLVFADRRIGDQGFRCGTDVQSAAVNGSVAVKGASIDGGVGDQSEQSAAAGIRAIVVNGEVDHRRVDHVRVGQTGQIKSPAEARVVVEDLDVSESQSNTASQAAAIAGGLAAADPNVAQQRRAGLPHHGAVDGENPIGIASQVQVAEFGFRR